MSVQRFPHLGKPLFKNMLQKQQISYRMQMHQQKIDNLYKTKSKFKQQFQYNPNLTYRTLLDENPKRNLMRQTKYLQIQRQNRLLLQKIKKAQRLQTQKPSKKKRRSSVQRNKSMNMAIRKKQIQEIQINNVRILGRITRQKPSISFYHAEQQYEKSRRFSQGLSKIQKYRLEDWY